MQSKHLLPTLIFVIGLASCDSERSLPAGFFKQMEPADRVEVTTPAYFVASVNEPWRIKRLKDWTERFPDHWKSSFHGAPVPELILKFRQGDKTLASYGIGHGFMTTGDAQQWAQPLAEDDRQKLLSLLRLRDTGATASAKPE